MSSDMAVEEVVERYLQKRNNALKVNNGVGGSPDLQITTRGSDWLWAVCALMAFSTIVFIALSARKPKPHRVFHYITAGVTMVAAISYYSLASNLGQTPIPVEFVRTHNHHVFPWSANSSYASGYTREIFYVRYIDWFITTPLLLLDLLLTADEPWPTILWVILVDWVMIVTGLVGALTRTRYKWGYYAIGCAALFYILYKLVWDSRRHANAKGRDIGRVFLMCGALTAVLWILYPVAWGLCEGGNVIHPDSEAIFYGVLDILSKPLFGALLIWGHRNIDPGRLGLHIRDYDEDPALHREKRTNGVGGVTNGVNTVNGAHDTVTGTSHHV